MQRVAVVGAGRLGRSLAAMAAAAGLDLVLVRRGEPMPEADVVWLTVPDRAIAALAATIPPGPLVLHASGATSLDALAPHARRGSLHPLMTFPGPEVRLPELRGVAAAIDAATAEDLAQVAALARALGLDPVRVPGDRALYHAAAVLAGNAATVLLAEAGRVLAAAGVDPLTARRMLAPLARASIDNAVADPHAALTGPAARGDHATLARHRAALADAGLAEVLPLYDAAAAAAARIASRNADDR